MSTDGSSVGGRQDRSGLRYFGEEDAADEQQWMYWLKRG